MYGKFGSPEAKPACSTQIQCPTKKIAKESAQVLKITPVPTSEMTLSVVNNEACKKITVLF